jgi:branched-chain amino acid transport system ATP-binding protein
MLEVKDLHVSYGKVSAVRGITLSVNPGRITLVLGANGAGKTTTLRAICGLLPPASGEVVLEGRSIAKMAAHKIVTRGLVMVPEGRKMFASLTVQENLRLGGHTADKSARMETLDKVYELFPILAERKGGQAGLLSGGEQQMLAFGRAMMSQPKVILMDEPSMGLAPTMIETVMSRARDIANSGIGVLMVEQNAEVGLEIADDVVIVARGEVVFSGPVEVARSHSSVLTAFLGEAALMGTE